MMGGGKSGVDIYARLKSMQLIIKRTSKWYRVILFYFVCMYTPKQSR